MALGPGKYDDLCTLVRERSGIKDVGGAIVIIIGDRGRNGFSCQADLATMRVLPDLLEDVARQIRQDAGNG
jgi:hypothetical protein